MLYFDRIPLWGNVIITISVGVTVGLIVMIWVKPRLRKRIEGNTQIVKYTNRFKMIFLCTEMLRKKRGTESISDEPLLKKTEGRFETYTGKLNHAIDII